jgi:hypothetical protein
MKKTLLTLAIAAVGALQAHAQLDNAGFESGSVGDSVITGWTSTGTVRLVSQASFNTTQGPQTQIPMDGSTKFIEIRAKKNDTTENNYFRGSITQHAKNTYGRPVNVQLDLIYATPSVADAMLMAVTFTKFDFTTGGHDTIGTAVIYTTGSSVYPWVKFGSAIQYKRNETPDSVHITILSNAASNSLNPNAVLYVDDIRFEDRPYTGFNEDNAVASALKVYPNPMTSSATISYTLAENSNVKLDVYDISGRLVSNVFNGNQAKGDQKATFERGNLTPGVYIYKLQAGSQVETGKIMITE